MRPELHDNTSDSRTCEALAPFLMALFDGEADELEARRARAHLLICQNCARRWLDWNHARTLIQGIPVVAPPPTLLWRLLLACRLEAFSRRNRSRRTIPTREEVSSAEMAPSALSAQILARTTRVTAPVVTHSTRKRRVWAPLAFPSLAVPALALWLIVLQRDTLFTVSPLAGEVQNPTSTLPVVGNRVNHFHAAPHASRAIVPTSSDRSAALKDDADEPTSKPLALPFHPIAPPSIGLPSSHETSEASPSLSEPRASKSRLETTDGSDAPHRAAPDSTEESLGKFLEANLDSQADSSEIGAAHTAPRLQHLTLSTPTRRASMSLRSGSSTHSNASFSDDTDTPRLRLTRWRTSIPRNLGAIGITSPTPSPSLVALPSTAPPAPARLIAENLDVDTQGVDEARSVVDDYRASLAPDDSTTTDDSSGSDAAG